MRRTVTVFTAYHPLAETDFAASDGVFLVIADLKLVPIVKKPGVLQNSLADAEGVRAVMEVRVLWLMSPDNIAVVRGIEASGAQQTFAQNRKAGGRASEVLVHRPCLREPTNRS